MIEGPRFLLNELVMLALNDSKSKYSSSPLFGVDRQRTPSSKIFYGNFQVSWYKCFVFSYLSTLFIEVRTINVSEKGGGSLWSGIPVHRYNTTEFQEFLSSWLSSRFQV
jgi:hypothetical protein